MEKVKIENAPHSSVCYCRGWLKNDFWKKENMDNLFRNNELLKEVLEKDRRHYILKQKHFYL